MHREQALNFAGHIDNSTCKKTEAAQTAAILPRINIANATACLPSLRSKRAQGLALIDLFPIHPSLTGQPMGIREGAGHRVTPLSQACARMVTQPTSRSKAQAPQQIAEAA
jgi:hypothetical protein